jgi:hypothetical protein
MPTNTRTAAPTPTITPTPGIVVSKSCTFVCYPCANFRLIFPVYDLFCVYQISNMDPKGDFTVSTVIDTPFPPDNINGRDLPSCDGVRIAPGASCVGVLVSGGVPDCSRTSEDLVLIDEIQVSGSGSVGPVTAFGRASTVLHPCGLASRGVSRIPRARPFRGTPGPNENVVTPIAAAPRQVPTNTPTNTPSPTNKSVQQQAAVPTVPTLSFAMLGLFAAAVLGAALWVLRGR